ncbi:MAG TPA: contractile injection system protein, VgrG/Pvc8 family [Chitinophaga sp.]|nr:contractile injection system protein, VgrG/Pvc8 family [Chitinophaga sp.]
MALHTKTSFSIAGKQFEAFSSMTLLQSSNNHHEFEILTSYDWFQQMGANLFTASRQFLGEEININVEPVEAAAGQQKLIFKGIVTSVSTGKESDGTHGFCVIKGYSPTILLDNDPHVQSFEAQSLQDIVGIALKGAPPNVLKSSVNPDTKDVQKYIVQYRENNWQFIRRLAARYGEWCFYDGQQLVFGKSTGDKTMLTHQIDLTEFDIELSVQPGNVRFNGYDYRQDSVVESDTKSQSPGKLNAHSTHALQVSEKLYGKESLYKMNYAFNSSAKTQIDKLARLRKKDAIAQMVILKGSSINTSLKIGDIVNIKEAVFSQEQHGEFFITNIRHYCEGNGNYYNMFEAIPADAASPEIHLDSFPHCEPQSATVVENNDPKGLGRIRVRFRWQQQGVSPWIRVVSASGGGDKGFFMIPEVGEEVITDFEGGNAELPFVIGTTYNGKAKSSFGNAGNDVKALKTRSGNTILLNDAAGSITVTDKNGSSMAMDGAGNITVQSQTLITVKTEDKIILEAPNSIEMHSKKININGKETVLVGEGATLITVDNTATKITSNAKFVDTVATQKLYMKGDANVNVVTAAYQSDAPSTNINGESVLIDGKKITNVNGGMLNLNC